MRSSLPLRSLVTQGVTQASRTPHSHLLSQGYDELDTLERPLFSAQDETDDYERTHGVAAPQSYRPPNTGGATGAASFTAAAAVPSQV